MLRRHIMDNIDIWFADLAAQQANEARGIWLNGLPIGDCLSTSGEVEYPYGYTPWR